MHEPLLGCASLMPRLPRSRRVVRQGLLAAVLVGGAWGCALVAGVDFDAARLAEESDAPGGGGPKGGGSTDGGTTTDAPNAARCTADQKTCSGACVAMTDPEFGCGRADCTPCSVALATGSTCAPDGGCVPKACAPGFDDCDGNPANGCEADLSRRETCGSCKTKCEGTDLCSPTGCVKSCTAPLVECNGACVDTQKSAAHCGQCNKPCPSAANADPACVNGACRIACRAGFGDCANNPPKACTALPKWFVDGDGDGFGAGASTAACTKPAGQVANSGDCLDSNPAVHPGAGASTTPFTGPAGLSFDYDCSGAETEEGTPAAKYAGGPCGALCNNPSGYQPWFPVRSGAGVNKFCGSSYQHLCIDLSGLGGGCGDGDYDSGVPIACK